MAAIAASGAPTHAVDERTYRRRIRAWTLYDWANSAFVTTIIAAVLPIYYSEVAGSTLPSESVATGYWSLTLSVSLFIVAILSPILGTISDVMRGKKLFLTVFVTIGVVATAALVLVGTGDWLLGAIIAVVGRIGLNGSIAFYDALLPHVAREEDQDRVSALGYALGYLGGGILLAINAGMIFAFGFEEGARWSFVSVAIWWAVFTIPLLRTVPEPQTSSARLGFGETISVSFGRLFNTLSHLRHYGELFKFLIAYLIYNDAIGTIIGVAAIYGAELGFDSIELILALLLVQFVGIGFTLIFGRLPEPENKRRALFTAFILFNVVALPAMGILGAALLPQTQTGVLLPPYPTINGAAGTGAHQVGSESISGVGFIMQTVAAATSGLDREVDYSFAAGGEARLDLRFNGREVTITHSTGPDHGIYAVLLDEQPVLVAGADDALIPLTIDAYSATPRYGVISAVIAAEMAGEHTVSLVSTGTRNPASTGDIIGVGEFDVLRPVSQSSLPLILGSIVATQLVGLLFAATIGKRIFAGLANSLNTKRSILLALAIYAVICIWGFFINSTIEFWSLAWMVAIVQGGSQALSRSLFSVMSPASKSGEFFGLFSIMEKFASLLGPIVFALAAASFGSSRPAILALIAFFIIGGYLLTRVNVEEGRRVAKAEDAAMQAAS